MANPWQSDDHLTCYYCKLHHPQVEAGGIWYCPNPLCTGPGQATSRMTLKSYRSSGESRYTIEAAELLAYAMDYLTTCEDVDVKASILRWIPWWENQAKKEAAHV